MVLTSQDTLTRVYWLSVASKIVQMNQRVAVEQNMREKEKYLVITIHDLFAWITQCTIKQKYIDQQEIKSNDSTILFTTLVRMLKILSLRARWIKVFRTKKNRCILLFSRSRPISTITWRVASTWKEEEHVQGQGKCDRETMREHRAKDTLSAF